jgi:serine/threonine protein kinase
MHPVDLIDWLENNELLRPEQTAEMRPLLPSFPNVRLLAKELVRREWLTPFQVNQIMTGKGDQLILGWLRMRERLGEGAMGQVFKAWNVRTQRVVAVKTLLKDLVANSRAMDRFRQEIEAAAQLDHPNIVKVRDADEIDSRPFMVMDYIDGVNLSSLIKTKGPLPVSMAVECARQAALALQHAFERGVVHRDVKPANLLLEKEEGPEKSGSGFRVKILDFGLARFDSERRQATRLTQLGSTLGTVDYMAPEQAESARDADTRADIYALGCTLYYLLTSRPPFPGSSMAEKVAARMTLPPPRVRAARPEVAEGLDAVVARMMARLPTDRYQTPAEVAAALQPYTGPASATVTPSLAAPLVVAVPRMEIDASVPLALPVTVLAPTPEPAPLAEPIAPPVAAALSVPPASPMEADGTLAPAPVTGGGEPFAASRDNPFATASTETPAGARPAVPAAAKNSMNPRVLLTLAGGGAVLVIVVLACVLYGVVSWMRGGKAVADAYPAGAGLEITEVRVSSDVLPIGSKKNVLVYVRRIQFNGPVDVRLEGLPDGVRFDKTTIAAGSTAVEVPIIASFGIEPVEKDVRVVAKAKNLTAAKNLALRVVAEAKKNGRP